MLIKLVEIKIRFLREWLFRSAMSDGVLSDSELKILFSIEFNLTLLQEAVDKAYEDHIIDKFEKNEIRNLINKIKDDAISSAAFDDSITKEAGVLLIILQTVLIEFQKLFLKIQ